jgi:hypothetical protein
MRIKRSGIDPLAYMGVEASNPPTLVKENHAPGATITEFNVGTLWIDTVANVVYMLTDITGKTAVWTTLGTGAGNDGQLLIGETGTTADWANITSAGATITITNGPNTINLEAAGGGGGGGITWNETTGATQAMAVDNGYVGNNAGLVTFTLPATAAFGTTIRVAGYGAGGWKIAQNAGQEISFNASTTTTGVTGYLSSTLASDSVELICVVADTTFKAVSSLGNITVA